MTSAVTLALEKLVQNPIFEHVVQFLSLGAPAPVDIDLIVNFVTKQDPCCDEDLTAAEISKCSLLMQLCPDDSSRVLIKMHQVVHEVFKKYLHDKYSKEQIAAFILSYIEALSPSAQHDPLHYDLEFHISSKMMAPHLKFLLESMWLYKLVSLTNGDKRNLLQNALFSFGDICRKHFFLWAAQRYFSFALQIAKDNFDGEDQNKVRFIATVLNNQGLVYHECGEFGTAEMYHKRALDTLKELDPQNSTPEVADSFNKLGYVYYNDGQIEKAKDYFQRALEIRESLYGPEHADVAGSISNLGSVHSIMGDWDTARKLFERSHALRESIYGKVHPQVADSLSNLGILYSHIGDPDEAVHYHKQALEMRKKLFFHDHVLISDSYNNLALAYQFLGELERAKECFHSALHIREKMSGKRHPALAGLLTNCSVLYMELDELKESKSLEDRALQIRRSSPLLHLEEEEGFITSDEPGRHFKSCIMHRDAYIHAILQGAKESCVDPFPPEKYPIKVHAEI